MTPNPLPSTIVKAMHGAMGPNYFEAQVERIFDKYVVDFRRTVT